MELNRRCFLAAVAAGAVQGSELFAAGRVPTHRAKPVKLFASPDGHPNALEATPEGLWVGEQVTDTAYLLDWKTGSVLKKVPTDSSNTSGLAYGGGYLWMGANGGPVMRAAHPDERRDGRIVKVDPEIKRTVAVYNTPDGGGVHGLVYAPDDTLWMTCFKWNAIAQVNPETFDVIHKFPLRLTRPHGLALDASGPMPGMWVGYSNDYIFLKQDLADGRVLEVVTLEKGEAPDPHGMDMYQGKMYVCDAGISPGPKPSGSAGTGFIYRLDW
jgi:streptogramin lyase